MLEEVSEGKFQRLRMGPHEGSSNRRYFRVAAFDNEYFINEARHELSRPFLTVEVVELVTAPSPALIWLL
jgi:hypothetical protein